MEVRITTSKFLQYHNGQYGSRFSPFSHQIVLQRACLVFPLAAFFTGTMDRPRVSTTSAYPINKRPTYESWIVAFYRMNQSQYIRDCRESHCGAITMVMYCHYHGYINDSDLRFFNCSTALWVTNKSLENTSLWSSNWR